jgi:riboflavin kinase / FMN adenylyltransferase
MQYKISGKVVRGDEYGRKIGFPTINLSRRKLNTQALPVHGVYAGKVLLGKKKYRAGIIIGPADKRKLPKIEAHLKGFGGNVYGKVAIFEIKKFLRKFKKFKTEKELIRQIEKDLKRC